MERVPLEITLLRGRTEPAEEGREGADDALFVVVRDVEEPLPLLADFVPDDGAPLEEGEPLDGAVLFDGADGFPGCAGTVACATGAPPPDRL